VNSDADSAFAVERSPRLQTPRLPLEASIDLTYRCSNRCRHCWLWAADTPQERAAELSTDEWREVVDQARALGTRRWSISGGEPMLRDDFAELFDYVTRKAVGYSLNTNGALIKPAIAKLLTRKGSKMIALYGATAEVHDDVTRTPGSFEATMEGFARLQEAGAGFTVQLIPMRRNWHQWEAMQELAQSLSRHWRVGASWLFMSACGDAARNAEIARQRLEPADVIALDEPIPEDLPAEDPPVTAAAEVRGGSDDRLYAACIAGRRDVHIDPCGGVAHCSFVKDPALRFSVFETVVAADRADSADRAGLDESAGTRAIRPGALERIWQERLPAVADAVCGGREYLEGCATCELRADCRWCDVYGYLEHHRHGARVEYLCRVAEEAREFKEHWRREHRRAWQIGGMTIRVDSDRSITDDTFSDKFRDFEVPADAGGGSGAGGGAQAGAPDDGRGADGLPVVHIRHHFGLPDLGDKDMGEQVYRRPPWAIFRKGRSWIYLGISPTDSGDGVPTDVHRVVTFNDDHTRARIYNDETRSDSWVKGGLASVTLFPTDQILLARILADRGGLFLHSGAVVLDGGGLCFIGHSEAGKSTTMSLLRDHLGERVEVLCDDRNIVRFWPAGPPPVPSETADGEGEASGPPEASGPGFWVHGTWSHGTVPLVSASQAPLRALVFLRQDQRNEVVPLTDRTDVSGRILACVIRPFVTADWWQKTFDVVEQLVATVPAYEMRFDKSGAVVPRIEALVSDMQR
jgi:MoaA/NifB/PqqE/SkfB family radical SAM enzyme